MKKFNDFLDKNGEIVMALAVIIGIWFTFVPELVLVIKHLF